MGISARQGVKVDDSAFQAHLKDYAAVMGKSMAEVIREQAGLFCLDMVKRSLPFAGGSKGDKESGGSLGARDAGRDNVRRSVYHIFQPIGNATVGQVASIGRLDVFKMWEKRNSALGVSGKTAKIRWRQFEQKYAGSDKPQFIEDGDMAAIGALHTSKRRDNGRGSLTPSAIHHKGPFAIVANDRDLQRYVKQKEKDVGILKSAYWFAAQRIKSDVKMPAWVKNTLGASNAIAEDKTNTTAAPEVTVGNAIGGKGTFDSLIKAAINYRAYAMRVKMAAKLNKDKVPLWLATAQGKTSGTFQHFS